MTGLAVSSCGAHRPITTHDSDTVPLPLLALFSSNISSTGPVLQVQLPPPKCVRSLLAEIISVGMPCMRRR